MNINTIEQRLRDKARAQLEGEAKDALLDADRLLHGNRQISMLIHESRIHDQSDGYKVVELYTLEMINELRGQIFEANEHIREEEEIERFLAQVDQCKEHLEGF